VDRAWKGVAIGTVFEVIYGGLIKSFKVKKHVPDTSGKFEIADYLV